MAKSLISSLTHFLSSDPSPFPSVLLLIFIFTFHIPTCRFFFSCFPPHKTSLYYNCPTHSHVPCKFISKPTPTRPGGRCGWRLRAVPVALLVVVSWLTRKDSAGVSSVGMFGTRCRHVSTVFGHCTVEDREICGWIWTPCVLVGMILVLFFMAQRQIVIRHCLFVLN